MKRGLIFLGIVCSIFQNTSYGEFMDDKQPPKVFLMPPEQIYSPPGFDSNDNVQLVITGYLPSTCFRVGATTAEVDHSTKTITVHNNAYFYSHSWCATVQIPFIKTIDLGLLQPGEYKVQAENWHGSFIRGENLPIQPSVNSGPDDFLYAVVDEVHYSNTDGKAPMLTVTGTLTGDCMELDRIELKYRSKNIIEVLPIVKLKGDSEKECGSQLTTFERQVPIQSKGTGAMLIHARSLNGQSINKEIKL